MTWCLVTFLPKIRREDSSKIQYSTERGIVIISCMALVCSPGISPECSNFRTGWRKWQRDLVLITAVFHVMERDVQSVWKLFGRNESKFDLTLAMLGGDNGISMANLAVHIALLVQMVPCDHDP